MKDIRIINIELRGADAFVAFASLNEQHGDVIAIHHTEVVLCVINLETENVAIMRDAGGNIVERQYRQGLPQARFWMHCIVLMVGLPKPKRVAVGILN